MIKKIFIQMIAAMMLVCGISVYAYDNDASVTIQAARTGYSATYNIGVSLTLSNKESYDYKAILNKLKPAGKYETDTQYNCVITIDDEEDYSIGAGYANEYFKKSGDIYWNFMYEFETYGRHWIDATIYKNGKVVEYDYICVDIYPSEPYSSDYSTGNENISYEYRLMSFINYERTARKLDKLYLYDDMQDLSWDRLTYVMDEDYLTHDYLEDDYDWYDIDYYDCEELFVIGACCPEEAMQILLSTPKGKQLIYGNWEDIGVCAICDDQNIMHWVIEVCNY